MTNFIAGTVFGIVVATVGFSGLAHMAVDVTKEHTRELAK